LSNKKQEIRPFWPQIAKNDKFIDYFSVPLCLSALVPLWLCLLISTLVECALQIQPFLTNKPNFRKSQINLSPFITTNYEQRTMNYEVKNKPNSNPIQSQFKPNTKPIQSQFKANSNPIQSQNEPKTNPISAQKLPKRTQFIAA
jgi:hypothetical protein